LLAPQSKRELEILHSGFHPGIYSRTSYSYEGEEAGHLRCGTLKLWVGERPVQFNEGDSFSFSSQEPHLRGDAVNVDAVVIWVITAPEFFWSHG
jgi:quercetin dioxygenase-like cupin family protein